MECSLFHGLLYIFVTVTTCSRLSSGAKPNFVIMFMDDVSSSFISKLKNIVSCSLVRDFNTVKSHQVTLRISSEFLVLFKKESAKRNYCVIISLLPNL